MSPRLTDLIESNFVRQHSAVIDVIDVVAVADPLAPSVVQSLVPSAAIDQAEAEGMIVIDTEARVVRLAHPLYGEARR
ncbi:helix-turn-helix transcriptional regulator, partial [Mycobacterium sp. ITM-2017-0098]